MQGAATNLSGGIENIKVANVGWAMSEYELHLQHEATCAKQRRETAAAVTQSAHGLCRASAAFSAATQYTNTGSQLNSAAPG